MRDICTPRSCRVHCRSEAERALDAAGDTDQHTDSERHELYDVSTRSIRDARVILAHADMALIAAVRRGEWPDGRRVSLREGAKQARAAQRVDPAPGAPAGEVRIGDFRTVLADVPSGSVGAIVTDVPWPPCAGYEPGLYDDLGKHAARLLRPGGAIAALVGQRYLPELAAGLAAHLDYVWTMAYVTPNGRHDNEHLFSWFYPVLIYCNGSFRPPLVWGSDLARAGWDVIDALPRDAAYAQHDYAKSPAGMGALVERVSSRGDLVIDPFAGSNPVGRACATLGRRFLGCDLYPRR